MLNSPLGGRRGIGFGLGRSWQRKADGWWLAGGIPAANCVAAYQPKGAASYAASKINLANPGTYDAYEGVAPSWDAVNGWKFDGNDDYLITDVTPNSADWSAFVRYTDLTQVLAGTNSLFGSYSDLSMAFLIQKRNNLLTMRLFNGSYGDDNGDGKPNGIYGFASYDVYFNGTLESYSISPGTAINDNLFIGAIKYSGGPLQNALVNIQAIVFYNITITSEQVSALYTAMAAL